MSNLVFPSQVKGLTYTVLKTPGFSTIVQKSPWGGVVTIPQYQNPRWQFELVWDYLYDTYYSPANTMAYAPYTDLQTLMGFFLGRQGQSDDFLFFDPADYCAAGLLSGVWQASFAYSLNTVIIDGNGHAQLVTTAGTSGAQRPIFSSSGETTTDGSATWTDQGYFPLGFPNLPVTLPLVTDGTTYYSPLQRSMGGLFMEDITDLVANTLAVYANGALQTGYTVNGPGLAIPGGSYAGLYLEWTNEPAAPITATFNFYFRVRFDGDTQDFERWAQGLWTIGGSQSKNGSGFLKLVTSRPSLA